MADQSLVITDLRSSWAKLLPNQTRLGESLLSQWSDSSRHYHGLEHLSDSLGALVVLGGATRAEHLAIWFHDAVHTNTPVVDEQRSAQLAKQELTTTGLPASEIAEVARLILITIDHRPLPEDCAGARIADADLSILGASPQRYQRSVADLRSEHSGLSEAQWRTLRVARLLALQRAEVLFHTEAGRRLWQQQARLNLATELGLLLSR